MAAGRAGNVEQVEQAICRLVEETSKGEQLLRRDFLGPACLAKFKSVEFLRSVGKPHSKYFIVASKRAVLTKSHIMAMKKPKKDGKTISSKIVAEFLGMEDGTLLERKDLSDLCRSLEKDVYELNGVTYLAMTNEKRSSFLRARSLEVYNFSEGSESSLLWDQLQYLVFSREALEETKQQEKNAAFSIRVYNFFHSESFFPGNDSQMGNASAASTTRKRFLKEDEFAEGDIPLGAIIVTKDCHLAGFMDFYNKHPVPLLFGSNFQTTGETLTHVLTDQESQGCSSGGVSHTSYQSQLAWLQSRLHILEDSSAMPCVADSSLNNSSLVETIPEQHNDEQCVISHGNGQQQNDSDQGPYPIENSCRLSSSREMVAYLPPKEGETESELPVGASGCIYPLLVSHLPAEGHISAGDGVNKLCNPDNTTPWEVTAHKHGENVVLAEADLNSIADPNNGSNSCDLHGRSRNEEPHHEELKCLEKGSSPRENSCSEMLVSVPAKDGETESDLPVGGTDLLLESYSPAESLVSVGAGVNQSNTHSNTQLGAAAYTSVDRVVKETDHLGDTDPSLETNINGRSSNEELQEEHWQEEECAVEGDHSVQNPSYTFLKAKVVKLPPRNDEDKAPSALLTEIVSEGASDKVRKVPSDNTPLRVPPDGLSIRPSSFTKEAPLSETKVGTVSSNNHKEKPPSRGTPSDGINVQSRFDSHSIMERVSGNQAKVVKSDKDMTPTRVPPVGLSFRPSSVTTEGANRIDTKLVAIPSKNGSDVTPSEVTTPNGLSSTQPPSVTTKAEYERAGTTISQEMSTQCHRTVDGSRRRSYPADATVEKKEDYRELKRYKSISLPKPVQEKRKFKPVDPLAKTILSCLDLLEGLSRCLDKEYKYGTCKCWKHIAEFFDIQEEEYQKFNCSYIQSPTEIMFEFLQTRRPEITVRDIKDCLHSIAREDVVGVLVKYEETHHTVNDGTFVSSLFDSDPDIIGEMAYLLDIQKKGLKNWSHLAAQLEIARADFKTFETSHTEYPATEDLFELVKIHYPRTTVRDLIGHLQAIKRKDVINAINECTAVTKDSLLKDLMEDLDVMENVCELLNQKQRTNKIKNWRHLGRGFGFRKETLDDLSPSQEEIVCPTEALIQYLKASNPFSALGELIWAIHLIDRDDALEVLDAYLEDGCISNLLASCNCEKCEKVREQDTRPP